MRFGKFLSAAALLVTCSCSGADFGADKDEKKDKDTSAQGAENEETQSTTGASLGLADKCTYEAKEDQACFTCTPREIAITQCGAADEGFDPSTQCSHDSAKMTCNLGSSKLVFEFDKKSPIEGIYERLPLLALGAKFLIGSKLDQFPKEGQALSDAIDLFQEHAKELFNTGKSPALVEGIVALIKTFKPDIPEDILDEVAAGINVAFDAFFAIRTSGSFGDGDVLGLVQALLKALPAEMTGALGTELAKIGDLSAIKDILAGADGKSGGLEGLLSVLAGGDLAKILASLGESDANATTHD